VRTKDPRPRYPAGVSKGKEFNDIIIGAVDASQILQFVEARVTEFHVINAVTALHRLAKTEDPLHVARDPRIDVLRDRVLHMFHHSVPKDEPLIREKGADWNYHVDMRALTNTIWAQAKMNIVDPVMLGYVSDEVLSRIGESSAQQMANCAWALGKLSVRNEVLLTAVADEATGRMDDFSPQNLMSLLWACAKLHFLHPRLMAAAAASMAKRPEESSPQHLSIVAWACATLGFRHPSFMDAIAQESMRTMRLFSPQNLANLAWAFATLDMRHDKLFSAISLSARLRLQEFNQQHMCNLAWALSALQITDEELLLAMADEVMRQIHEYNPQGLSNIACAFAVLGLAHNELFDAIAAAATQLVYQCTPRDLESIAWAFARLGIEKEALMSAISDASLQRIHEFRAMDLANMAWAFATLGLLDEPLMCALSSEVVVQVGEFSSQALGHTAWAFSMLGCADQALMDAISQEVRKKINDLEVQHIAVLLDAGLSCSDVLGRRMGAMLRQFLEAFPKSEEEWRRPEYPKFLKMLQVDNFGLVGSQFLLARIGIEKAPADFCERAAKRMRSYIRENNAVLQGLTTKDVLHKRVCSFMEYSLVVSAPLEDGGMPVAQPFTGAMLRENGYWTASATRGGKCRWLQAAKGLKAGALVDRTLCSEFQMLEELCDGIERAGVNCSPERRREAVQGGVRMFVSTTPCISCVGALGQFLLMFPGIKVEMANGKIPIRQGWKKDGQLS